MFCHRPTHSTLETWLCRTLLGQAKHTGLPPSGCTWVGVMTLLTSHKYPWGEERSEHKAARQPLSTPGQTLGAAVAFCWRSGERCGVPPGTGRQ